MTKKHTIPLSIAMIAIASLLGRTSPLFAEEFSGLTRDVGCFHSQKESKKERAKKHKEGPTGPTGPTGAKGAAGPTGASFFSAPQYISCVSTNVGLICDSPIDFTTIYAQSGITLTDDSLFTIHQTGVYTMSVWFDSTDPTDTAAITTTGSNPQAITVGSIIPFTVDLALQAGDTLSITSIGGVDLTTSNASGRSAYFEMHRIN